MLPFAGDKSIKYGKPCINYQYEDYYENDF